MTDNIGQYMYINGAYCEAETAFSQVNIIENSEKGRQIPILARIYEVIRYVDGIPLFWEEHIERLNASLSAYLEDFPIDSDALKEECSVLIKKCKKNNCNIQIVFYIHLDRNVDKVVYVKKHFYPTTEMYENGVAAGVVHINRDNPSVKNWIPSYKSAVQDVMKDNFEVLLANDQDEILEGSRSNFFYVKDGLVYTCPQHLVLNGITRINVLRAIEKCGLDIVEKSLNVNELANIDGAFLSGTSLNVLPIRCIDDNCYIEQGNKPEIITKIMNSFDKIVEDYLNYRKA